MATKQSRSKSKGAQSNDVYALLKEDHQKVQKLFQEFQKLHDQDGDSEEMDALARQICMELTIHAQVEEEIFYPALREALEETDLLDEAKVEHDSAKMLIEMIQEEDGDPEMFAARVIVLGEYINHHIDEEQKEIFPAARKAKVDAAALGAEVMARKEELQSELGMTDGGAARAAAAEAEDTDDEDEDYEEDEDESERASSRAARSGDGTRPVHR